MEERVAEVIKEMGEMRRRMKGLEGKIYKLEEENIEFGKRIEMLEEESFRKVGEKEGLKEICKKRGEEMKEIREVLKKMSVKESDSEMEEGECLDWIGEKEEEGSGKKETRKKGDEEDERRERRRREDREKEWRKKVLIVKRGAKANKTMEIERWVKKVIGDKKIRIMKAMSNKEAVKIYFASEKEKEEIWEKREKLRKEEDMLLDRWLTIEERKERYKLLEKTFSLREEYKEEGLKLFTRMEQGERRDRKGEGRRNREMEREKEKESRERERGAAERREREEQERFWDEEGGCKRCSYVTRKHHTHKYDYC